jgi:uncharacterized protein involved in exopolysaccharide biosynthesis
MPPIIKNSLETIEGVAKTVGGAAQKGMTDVGSDVVESITGNTKPLPNQQKQQIKQDDTQKQQVIRQNLVKLNEQIIQARKKREESYKQATQAKEEKKEEKKFEEKKKENFLMKLIKSRKGTKEGMQRASG